LFSDDESGAWPADVRILLPDAMTADLRLDRGFPLAKN
jgi:hypothetical protein